MLIEQQSKEAPTKTFMGMSDQEILNNKDLFTKMGLM